MLDEGLQLVAKIKAMMHKGLMRLGEYDRGDLKTTAIEEIPRPDAV